MYKKRPLLFTVLLSHLLSGGCQAGELRPITVPATASLTRMPTEAVASQAERWLIAAPPGKPQAIDGTLSPGEWDDAAKDAFSDGSELFLMYSEGYLYLGIRANTPEMIAGNVFVAYDDRVEILHVSAALATAVYRQDADRWLMAKGFKWCCRSTVENAAAQDERSNFLRDEHWVAANSRIGAPNELEYQIEVTGQVLSL